MVLAIPRHAQARPSLRAKLGAWLSTSAGILQGSAIFDINGLADGDTLPDGDGNSLLWIHTVPAGAQLDATNTIEPGDFDGQQITVACATDSQGDVEVPHGGNVLNARSELRILDPGESTVYVWFADSEIWVEILNAAVPQPGAPGVLPLSTVIQTANFTAANNTITQMDNTAMAITDVQTPAAPQENDRFQLLSRSAIAPPFNLIGNGGVTVQSPEGYEENGNTVVVTLGNGGSLMWQYEANTTTWVLV